MIQTGKNPMRIVMPLFDFHNDSSEEFIFEGGKYALRRFNPDDEIPNTDLFSKLDVKYMKRECWAIVAENPDVEKYKQEVNILLLSFKIYRLAPLFIKYRLCKEDETLCSILYDTMQYVLREKSCPIIVSNDLVVINNGFSNLLQMRTISNRTQNALYFLYRGFHSSKMIDCFMFLMSAVESLFSGESRGGVTKIICSRVSSFLNNKERCKYQNIEDLYDLRSKIVHGRVTVDDEIKGHLATLHELEYVITECMKKMLDEKIYLIYEDAQKKEIYFSKLVVGK
ncbi:MAG: hypothetical protein A2Z25_10005 [Planctomycetes bacterium RBG_16_55_9]|nr:MAG: hypothetical protein A2Z25_10005 [Planctomycetes bacterium RBG_16_55_9]